jgi:hypothetical protein
MLKKYKDQLNQMYDQHSKLKNKLIYVINQLLNPKQFEAEWEAMLDAFGLHGVTMQVLYSERHMWIAAYFKQVFFETIQSTQRSDSVNSMVKGGYVDNSKSVHEFVKASWMPWCTSITTMLEKNTTRMYDFFVYSYSVCEMT